MHDAQARSPSTSGQPAAAGPGQLPWAALLALAAAGFLTILTEALPAGLLPAIGADLGVSEGFAGQLVTLYAIGSLLAAIPLTAATRGWRRRPLLMLAVGGFAIVNLITAVSVSYPVTLAARFGAGVFAGLLWALLAGYASRMVPEAQQGRAIAVAMIGTPLALSLGIPAGTLLGGMLGWRITFAAMSVLSLVLLACMRIKVPDFPGQAASVRLRVSSVFVLPGLRSVLAATLLFVLAHNILYTYVAPLSRYLEAAHSVDAVLLLFGLAAIAGIWVVGNLVDRWLRPLVLASFAMFGVAAWLLGTAGQYALAAWLGTVLWGLAFGGAATLFQTASARTAGNATDIAQSLIVTVWNLGIAGGGLSGAFLLQAVGPGMVFQAALVLLAIGWAVAWKARAHGFRG